MRPLGLASLIAIVLTALPARDVLGATTLDVVVDGDLRIVTGEVCSEVVNVTSEPVSRLYLWLPMNRLRRPPAGMDQRTSRWIYPRSFSAGGLDLTSLTVAGVTVPPDSLRFPGIDRPGLGQGQQVLAAVPLEPPLAPGERLTVTARFRATVPARFGRIGRARGVLTLAGGFYPQVALLTPSGWSFDGPMADDTFDMTLSLPPDHEAVVNGRHVQSLPDESPVVLSLGRVPYVALVVARRFEVSRATTSGVAIEYLSTRHRYHAPAARRARSGTTLPEGLPDPFRRDYEARVLETARATIDLLRRLGVRPAEGTVIRLVEAPMRLEMVSHVPSSALVSDRVYRLTPLEPFLRLHDLQVVRAVASIVLEPYVAREAIEDRAWVLDLLAASIGDLYAAQGEGHRVGVRQILEAGAFIPEVDQLLYSPLIEFRHLFLRPVRDEDPVRDEPSRFATSWPRGALLNDKLVDLLGQDALRRLATTYAFERETLRGMVSALAGEDMAWFFAQWLGPYPEVNYGLADVRSERLEDGRYRHTIVLEREGADIREPVEVVAIDRHGERHLLRWDGRGRSGEVRIDSPARLASVEIDPRRRLVESARLVDQDPRFDNARPWPFRPPVFNGLLFYVSAAEAEVFALVDFSLRRRHDARNAVRLRVEYDPRGLSADLLYRRGLGPLLDNNTATWVLESGLSVLRARGEFGDQGRDGTVIGLGARVYHDTRWYPYDPMEGRGFALAVNGAAAVSDDGEWTWSVSCSARIAGHVTPALGHTLTGYAGAGLVVGEPLEVQLQSLSGRFRLRAFEADETLGRGGLYGALEYRWAALPDISLNLFQLAWLRAVHLAVFSGAGWSTRGETLETMFSSGDLFVEVGAGVRFLLELVGAQPYIVAVDVGVPLLPSERDRCPQAGACVPRQPIGVYVSIQQTL